MADKTNDTNDKEQFQEDLIDHLEELRKEAEKGHPTADFQKDERYYTGNFTASEKADNLINSYNICKPIVETKTTFVLDAKPVTQIVPKVIRLADLQQMKLLNDIADVYNACWENVQRINKFNKFRQKITRRGIKLGMGIAHIFWDPDLSDGIGDVKIGEINPLDFLWDQSAVSVETMNYCFIKQRFSPMTLKEKYAKQTDGSFDMDMIKKIDSLLETKPDDKQKSETPSGITASSNDQYTEQAFVYGSVSQVDKAKEDIVTWTIYFKDDSIFAPDTKDTKTESDDLEKFAFKYPHGRMIHYAIQGGQRIIFDDKPIDYPFGFPISIFNPIDTDKLEGMGDIRDLRELQERINKSYVRLKNLVQRYVSILAYDPKTTGLKPGDIVNAFTLPVEQISQFPDSIKVITNNTLAEIVNILKMIDQMKQEAKEIARVNDIMISGERPAGVTSGEQIRELNVSPQTSIRAIQSNFTEFLVDVTNKAIALIGLYYNVPRMVRMSEGKFARIGTQGNIQITNTDSLDSDTQNAITEIKGDLSVGEYECEIVYGTETPRTRTEIAQLTMQLAQSGYLGNPSSIPVKEKVLKELDYPNYRSIVNDMNEEAQNQPQQTPTTPGLQVNFADLPAFAQNEWLTNNGFTVPAASAPTPNTTGTPAEVGPTGAAGTVQGGV